jgi:hypothetical protein
MNINDYEKKCPVCKFPFINCGGMWLHQPDIECSVEDGIRIVKKEGEYNRFVEEYGVPKYSTEEMKLHFKKELKNKDDELQGLKELLTVLEQRRWYEWLWESTKEMLMKINFTKNSEK